MGNENESENVGAELGATCAALKVGMKLLDLFEANGACHFINSWIVGIRETPTGCVVRTSKAQPNKCTCGNGGHAGPCPIHTMQAEIETAPGTRTDHKPPRAAPTPKPRNKKVLTAGVDIQKDQITVSIKEVSWECNACGPDGLVCKIGPCAGKPDRCMYSDADNDLYPSADWSEADEAWKYPIPAPLHTTYLLNEHVRIHSDGKLFVHGKEVETDEEIREGFRDWLKSGGHIGQYAKQLFLVVYEDRHTDNEYTLFTNGDEAAEFALSEIKKGVPNNDYKAEAIPGWLLSIVDSCEDGPKVHIETIKIEKG